MRAKSWGVLSIHIHRDDGSVNIPEPASQPGGLDKVDMNTGKVPKNKKKQ